jgi:hypothetical protein
MGRLVRSDGCDRVVPSVTRGWDVDDRAPVEICSSARCEGGPGVLAAPTFRRSLELAMRLTVPIVDDAGQPRVLLVEPHEQTRVLLGQFLADAPLWAGRRSSDDRRQLVQRPDHRNRRRRAAERLSTMDHVRRLGSPVGCCRND